MPPPDAEELFMTRAEHQVFEALNPFFEVIMVFVFSTYESKKVRWVATVSG